MSVLPLLARTAASAGLLVVVVAAPATAQVCDAYSGSCTESTGVLSTQSGEGAGAGATQVRGSGAGAGPTTLPFTGGELVLVSLAGAGALAAGAGLVAAGRRRTAAQV